MTAVRRFAGLLLVVTLFAGCNKAGNPVADAPAEAEPAPAPQPDTLPAGDASLVRAGKGSADVPPPPKPKPKPGEIVIPEGGGSWPWNLSPAPEASPFQPVTIPEIKDWITGFAVTPAAKRAVLTVKVAKAFGNPDGTQIIWCDTGAGKVLAEWEVNGTHHVYDVSPDGRRILTRKGDLNDKKETLTVWTVTDGNELKSKSFKPHDVESNDIGGGAIIVEHGLTDPSQKTDGPNVEWAAFVGPNRIVSSAKSGQLRVYDATTFARLGSIEATRALPAVTPDGTKVCFVIRNGLALLDPETAQVVGAKWIGTVPELPVVAVSPDAKTVAVGGTGKVRYLDLTTAEVWDTVHPTLKVGEGTTRHGHSFGWAGTKYLFNDHFLYHPDLPIAAWDYGGVGKALCRGWQTWVVVKWFDKVGTVRPFVFPHDTVEARVAAKSAEPGVLTLRPGDGVKIDVSGIPADRQAEVRATLGKRLKTIGYVPDPNGVATLIASEDKTGVQSYASYIGYKAVPYTRRPARLKLVKDTKVLWEQDWAYEPPFSVMLSGKRTLTDVIRESSVGEPNYRLFERAQIPAMFTGPKAPIFAFGSSDLKPNGITDKR